MALGVGHSAEGSAEHCNQSDLAQQTIKLEGHGSKYWQVQLNPKVQTLEFSLSMK